MVSGPQDELQQLPWRAQMEKVADRLEFRAGRPHPRHCGPRQLTADQKMDPGRWLVSRDVLASAAAITRGGRAGVPDAGRKFCGRLGYTADASHRLPRRILQRVSLKSTTARVAGRFESLPEVCATPAARQEFWSKRLSERGAKRCDCCSQRPQKAERIELVERKRALRAGPRPAHRPEASMPLATEESGPALLDLPTPSPHRVFDHTGHIQGERRRSPPRWCLLIGLPAEAALTPRQVPDPRAAASTARHSDDFMAS